jgi:hypothetical protein
MSKSMVGAKDHFEDANAHGYCRPIAVNLSDHAPEIKWLGCECLPSSS